ncbi:MAG: multicopper oxidase domain-containing protein [Kiritimatiellae bacterium]|nr:multicopper oxidase domain-containing protein [Kiritimatiellia bacterium]
MSYHCVYRTAIAAASLMAAGLLTPALAERHWIDGVSVTDGGSVTLTARDGHIKTPEGGSLYMWGYAAGEGAMQYPGPTLIMNEGASVQINLHNTLTTPVSIVFPGQEGVQATGGEVGALTREAAPNGGVVSYAFTASRPGTYLYHSGTRQDLQVEMGLIGALIVRPAVATQAYNHASTVFDHEYLFLLTEADPNVHAAIETGHPARADMTSFWPVYWFINGRCGPDTMSAPGVAWLPNQPYDCSPMMYPGEKLLMRLIGAGRDLHPYHMHGNNATIIARDGRLLESVPGVSGPDLAESDFTITVAPGQTTDAIFEWTGAKLGWDIYGHTSTNEPMMPNEYAPDHGKSFPVTLPNPMDLTYGGHYSGSPFLGGMGMLPPANEGLNPYGAFMYMWHSHNEKEIVNNNVFPGGMLTMMMVMPPMTNMVMAP